MENLNTVPHRGCINLHSPLPAPTQLCPRFAFSLHFHQLLLFLVFWIKIILTDVRYYPVIVWFAFFWWHNIVRLFMYLLACFMSSLKKKCLFMSSAHFLIRLFVGLLLLLRCMNSLSILNVNPCQKCNLQIFSPTP